MPHGYYTIEEWARPKNGGAERGMPVAHLALGASLTAAERRLAELGKPGFYRVVQTQRVIWAEREAAGNLRLRKSHAGSPENLEGMRQMFERSGGRYPVEEVRAARR